jgi:flagellar hook-associated protein FlgK
MADYYIGLSGLTAAQRAFEVIGNNIANAATEGYHRQKIQLSPAFSQMPGQGTFIGGVNVDGVARMVDTLLEEEILRQKSTLASTSQQTTTLSTIEAAFGEFATDNGGLNAAIDNFFTSLQNLSSHPDGAIWQNQAVSDAELMAGQFKSLAQFMESLQNQIKLEAEYGTETINTLTGQIAELNQQIERLTLIGGQTSSMQDHRDQCITQLSELIGVQTIRRENGVVDISAGGIGLVTGSVAVSLEAGYDSSGRMGFSAAGASTYSTNIEGGKMGGLLTLHNRTVSGFLDDLNALAGTIIRDINAFHVTGTGSTGSFSELTGNALSSIDLADLAHIADGTVYIRMTDTGTGQITRHAVTIDAANDTLNDVAARIAAIPGVTAAVNGTNQLIITADTGYQFDFLPGVLPDPTTVEFDDANPPAVTVSGIYSGAETDTFEFKIIGDGAVGNGTLAIEVRSAGGTGGLVKTLNIGSGYAAGDLLDVGNGIQIALSVGNLTGTGGDRFTVQALADTDTAGFLSAVGINTFFSGSGALDMAITSSILQDPRRVAASLGLGGTDNANIMRMADIRNTAQTALGSLTVGQFYQRLASTIGQELSTRQMQQDNIEAVILNLVNRQSDISGININEEAAQLLLFEQMFQAMAEYMNTLNQSMASLMEIV